MAAFQFRLQPILDLRSHLEKEQKDFFANETHKLNKLLDQKQNLENRFTEWSQNYMLSAQKGISPEEAVRICYYLDEVQRQIKQSELQIAAQNKAVEAARLDLVEKMRDRKVIEALKEKQLRSFQTEEQKKQEKQIEEYVVSRITA